MGKSPGKWIKGLFRKKTSQSEISKGRVLSKSASERPSRTSSKELITTLSVGQPLISDPIPITKECDQTLKVVNDENVDRDGDVLKATDEFSERNELDLAALSLQAFIRGHLVRRQAVATSYCVQGIVKIQALARGYLVRKNNAGTAQFRGKTHLAKNAECLDISEINTNVQASGLPKNAFIYKLCGSSVPVMPLRIRLKYDQGEPNSAWNWMIRWSKLQVLAIDSKSAEIESFKSITNDKEKQNLALNSENCSIQSSEPAKENELLCENEKVEHGQKLEKPALEVSTEAELDAEKPFEPLSKVTDSSTTLKSPEQNSDLGTNNKPIEEDTQKPAPMKDDDDVKPGLVEDILGKLTISNLSSDKSTNGNFAANGKEFKDDLSSRKSSRRASLPAKHDGLMTPEITVKVPSYMATTASSKAKVKAQASPRLGLDRNSLDRRLSLPSSVNVKMSSSPRVQKVVQGNNRREGMIKIGRSLSSSRDVAGKMMQVDWKR